MAGDRATMFGLLLAKQEGTEGTDSVPTQSSNTVQINEPLEPNSDYAFKHERPKLMVGAAIQASPPLQPKGRMGTWSNTVNLRGTRDGLLYSASNLPDLDAFLQSAGLTATVTVTAGSEKVVYTPAASSLKSHTEYYYVDGRLTKMLAAKADVDFAFDAGGPVIATCKRTGLVGISTDASVPSSPVFGSAVPPTADSMAVTINSYATGIIRKWSMNIGNQIAQRPNANASGGLSPHKIRSRVPKWSITLEDELAATKDFETLRDGKTAIALSWFLNASQYNRLRWTAPAAIIESVSRADDNGTQIVTIGGGLYDSAAAANDAFSLAFE